MPSNVIHDSIQPIQSVTDQRIYFLEEVNFLVIKNAYYIAKIDKLAGQINKLEWRLNDNSTVPQINTAAFRSLFTLVEEDRFDITVEEPTGNTTISTTNLSAQSVVADPQYDFYLKLTVICHIKGFLYYRRTYEFTQSPHIYEHVSFYLDNYSTGSGGLSPVVKINDLTWHIRRKENEVTVLSTSFPFIVDTPNGPIGGTSESLGGSLGLLDFIESPQQATGVIPEVFGKIVNRGYFAQKQRRANLTKNETLLAGAVISVGAKREEASLELFFKDRLLQFYPEFGLRSDKDKNKYSFVEWNDYDCLNWLIPHIDDGSALSKAQKDCLIRITMHMVARMKKDQWWPTHYGWSSNDVDYPEGDIQTRNARSFPQLAYTWALLSMHPRANQAGTWDHINCEADVIYHTLQNLYNHYITGSGFPNFEDVIIPKYDDFSPGSLPDMVPYISYSAHRKGRTGDGPLGVFNTHADGLQLAWVMMVASELFGDNMVATKWHDLIIKYHEGSKALFDYLYPAISTSWISYGVKWGLLQYAVGRNKMEPWYTHNSYEGIAAGYMITGEYEIEFVDAVELASHGNFDPLHQICDENGQPSYIIGSEGKAGWVGRLCRLFPPAITFAGDTLEIGGAAATTHLKELLELGILKATNPYLQPSTHDINKAITEDNGRHIILTNKPFISTWVAGFWEEMDPSQLPIEHRFQVWIQPQLIGQYWTACRTKGSIQMMTNYTPDQAIVSFPFHHLKWTIHYYYYQSHRWLGPYVVGSGEKRLPSGQSPLIDITMPFGISNKVLAVILYESDDYGHQGVLEQKKLTADPSIRPRRNFIPPSSK